MKDWIIKQSDSFYRKTVDIRKSKLKNDLSDKWIKLSNELANKLLTSSQWHNRIITCEWCFVIGLSSWLVFIVMTILH